MLAAGIDRGGIPEVGLEVGDHFRIHLKITGLLVGNQPDHAGLVLLVGQLHFADQGNRGMQGVAGAVEKGAGRLDGKRAHPAGEARAAAGRVNPEMGEVHGAGGPLGRGVDDGGVVADGGDLVLRIEGENHGVVKQGFAGLGLPDIPAETVLDDGAGFHFVPGTKQLGELVEGPWKEGILRRFDEVKLDAAKIGGGGALVSGGEVGRDELGRVDQTKAGA